MEGFEEIMELKRLGGSGSGAMFVCGGVWCNRHPAFVSRDRPEPGDVGCARDSPPKGCETIEQVKPDKPNNTLGGGDGAE